MTITVPGTTTLRKVVLADINNDNLPDILAARGSPQQGFVVLINQGGGSFSAPQVYASTTGASDIITGNFNGDNYKDVVIMNTGAANVVLNNGDGTFGTAQPVISGTAINTGAAADLNADGKADLAVGGNLTNPMRVVFGNGDNKRGLPGALRREPLLIGAAGWPKELRETQKCQIVQSDDARARQA